MKICLSFALLYNKIFSSISNAEGLRFNSSQEHSCFLCTSLVSFIYSCSWLFSLICMLKQLIESVSRTDIRILNGNINYLHTHYPRFCRSY